MKNSLLVLACMLFAFTNLAQTNNILRGIITYKSSGSKPEKGVSITSFGTNAVYSNDAGQFELVFTKGKIGDKVTLVVQKEGYQVVGSHPLLVEFVIPSNPNDLLQIAVVKTSDLDAGVASFRVSLEKRLKEQDIEIKKLQSQLQSKALSEEERKTLSSRIATLNQQIQELNQNKEELAKQLAQTNLDQASEFAKEALVKFEKNGDIKAALSIMNEEKLSKFWSSVQEQEAKIRRARAQAVENYMIRARMLIADFQFAAADTSFLMAIEKDSTNINNLRDFAVFLFNQNQYNRSIHYYEKCLQLARNEEETADFRNNLGILYASLNRFDEAEKSYIQCRDIRKKLAETTPQAFEPELASVLNNLGILYRSQQRFDEAESFYIQCRDIRQKLVKESPQKYEAALADVFNNLGNLYRERRLPAEAETVYNQSREIYQNLAQKNAQKYEPSLAEILSNLGGLHIEQKRFDEAEKVYLTSKDIFLKFAKDNPQRYEPALANTLFGLGFLYRSMKKFEEAKDVYLQSIDICIRFVEHNPKRYELTLARTWNILGVLYRNLKQSEEAEKAYLKSKDIYDRLSKNNSEGYEVDYVQTLNNLANHYYSSNKFEATIEARKKIVFIWEGLHKKFARDPKTKSNCADANGRLSYYYLFVKDFKNAELASRRGLELDTAQIWIYSNLAHSLLFQGRYKEALTIYKQYKGQAFNEKQTWIQVFLADLDELEKVGITHPKVEKVRKLLRE